MKYRFLFGIGAVLGLLIAVLALTYHSQPEPIAAWPPHLAWPSDTLTHSEASALAEWLWQLTADLRWELRENDGAGIADALNVAQSRPDRTGGYRDYILQSLSGLHQDDGLRVSHFGDLALVSAGLQLFLNEAQPDQHIEIQTEPTQRGFRIVLHNMTTDQVVTMQMGLE